MKKIVYISLVFSLVTLLASCSEDGSDSSNARIKFTETEFAFGKIAHKSDGTHEFEFENTGKVPLVITNVKSSCGCTIPSYPKEPVETGKKGIIKVKYDTNRVGMFTKSVKVFSNAKDSPVKLIISGEILPPVEKKTEHIKDSTVNK